MIDGPLFQKSQSAIFRCGTVGGIVSAVGCHPARRSSRSAQGPGSLELVPSPAEAPVFVLRARPLEIDVDPHDRPGDDQFVVVTFVPPQADDGVVVVVRGRMPETTGSTCHSSSRGADRSDVLVGFSPAARRRNSSSAAMMAAFSLKDITHSQRYDANNLLSASARTGSLRRGSLRSSSAGPAGSTAPAPTPGRSPRARRDRAPRASPTPVPSRVGQHAPRERGKVRRRRSGTRTTRKRSLMCGGSSELSFAVAT